MNFGNVRSGHVKFFFFLGGGGGGGGGGLIFETNCIFEYKPSPHFWLDVVYKMGGRINGTLRYKQIYSPKFELLPSILHVCLCVYVCMYVWNWSDNITI